MSVMVARAESYRTCDFRTQNSKGESYEQITR